MVASERVTTLGTFVAGLLTPTAVRAGREVHILLPEVLSEELAEDGSLGARGLALAAAVP